MCEKTLPLKYTIKCFYVFNGHFDTGPIKTYGNAGEFHKIGTF